MEGVHDTHFQIGIPGGIWQTYGAVLDDLNTLGQVAADGQFLVGTGAGTFAYESGDTARTSIGLGTGDTPTFTGLTIVNTITEFSTDGTLDGNSDSAVSTEKAIKTYVDNNTLDVRKFWCHFQFDTDAPFTEYTSGTGSHIKAIHLIRNNTGNTLNSEAAYYVTRQFYMDKDNIYRLWKYSFTLYTVSLNPDTREVWAGFLEHPTAPAANDKHCAMYVDTSGDMYASCGDGVGNTQVDTGVDLIKGETYNVKIEYFGTQTLFYINNSLVATVDTNQPDNASVNMGIYITNSGAAAAGSIDISSMDAWIEPA